MGIARDHHAAVVALLDANPVVTILEDEAATPAETGLNVYTNNVPPSAPDIYAVLTVNTPRGEAPRLSGHRAVSACRIALMYVGKTQEEVLWAADIGQATFNRARPISATRNCTPLEGGGAVVRKDTDINPGDWLATETWQFASTPKETP